jgi:hypothetical protein
MHTGCGLEFGADSEKMDTNLTGPDKIKRNESIISTIIHSDYPQTLIRIVMIPHLQLKLITQHEINNSVEINEQS